ncbi:MAG TPA: carboxypeptidase-like regulatory domain-containing protein, partial [Kofleriaceae bacterium]
ATIDIYDDRSGSQARYALAGRAPDNFTGNHGLTDALGRFTVGGLDASHHHLRATLAGEAPLDRALDLAATGAPITVQFASAARCDVHVVGADRHPAGNLVVVLEGRDGNRESTSLVTDPDGLARFDHLPAGTYRARAIMPGQPTTTCTVTAGQSVAVTIAAQSTASAQR